MNSASASIFLTIIFQKLQETFYINADLAMGAQ